MKVEVKKIYLENYKKFSSKSVDLFPRTEISGRNREGKSTLQDAYLDVLTGKMANGTEPTSIRRKENGVEVPKVDVVRELTLAIDGKEKVIRKITKQKWRKPRGQSEEVFDGNETSYEIDGFPAKSKDYTEFIQSIAEPSTLVKHLHLEKMEIGIGIQKGLELQLKLQPGNQSARRMKKKRCMMEFLN